MKNLTGVLIYLLMLLAAAALGYKFGGRRDVTRIEKDTVYAERFIHHADTITNWRPEYIYIPYAHDSVIAIAEAERLDTTLVKYSDTLSLNIERHPLPYVHYNVGFDFRKHDSVRTITETVYLQKQESFFSRFNIGIGAGINISKYGSEYRSAPGINLSVYYKLF